MAKNTTVTLEPYQWDLLLRSRKEAVDAERLDDVFLDIARQVRVEATNLSAVVDEVCVTHVEELTDKLSVIVGHDRLADSTRSIARWQAIRSVFSLGFHSGVDWRDGQARA